MRKNYQSVGIIIVARDTNNFLLLHRVNAPLTWSALAGGMEEGENPIQTVKREIHEEIGLDPSLVQGIRELGTTDKMGHVHHVIIGYVDTEFDPPNLKMDENDDYGWFNETNLPTPIHPGFGESFQYIKPLLNLRESFKQGFNKLINE